MSVVVGVFIVNFEHISHLFLAFLLLTLNMWLTAGQVTFTQTCIWSFLVKGWPKGFLGFVKNHSKDLFVFFALSYCSIKAELVFCLFVCLFVCCFLGGGRGLGQKYGPRVRIFKFYVDWNRDMFLTFAWSYSNIKAWNCFRYFFMRKILFWVFGSCNLSQSRVEVMFFLVLNSLKFFGKIYSTINFLF